ncbi:MAG: ABC transporter ATP-binding protein [Candidatus Caenarcaniphilales bacterium]|jgi:oligopeptide/dipeptide ABC transporter ATP-binding protein|nr:ABC transporter ATP-binding protein [Candidatus Caenarcaniphilales bacterium]
MAESILKVKNLSKTFSVEKNFFGKDTVSLKAVRNINLEILPGECLALIGESGCGKSTLARLIVKLIEADEGEIIFEGVDLNSLENAQLRKKRKDFQMIFQNPSSSLDPKYKIKDSIAEPLIVHGLGNKNEIKQKVKELIELVELPETILEKYPHECSGGQNQRVSIARALALNPKLIVADEAVSALDQNTQETVLALIKKLQVEKNISFLFITHSIDVVKRIADRVAVMYLGQIVEEADAKTLLASPQHPYTRALLAAAPVKDPRDRNRERILLQGDLPKPTQIPTGCSFHTRCPFVVDKCKSIDPKLEGQAHKIACLRQGEI